MKRRKTMAEKIVNKRPSKKVLIAQIEAMGVERKIAQSLNRANIETIQYFKNLLELAKGQ